MIYYALAAIFPLIAWFLYDYIGKVNKLDEKGKEKLRKQLVFLAALPIFFLFVFRYKTVGSDTIGYVKFFQSTVRQYSFQQLVVEGLMRSEIGYRLYVKLISLFTKSYTVYFIINGIIIFGTLIRFSLKYTKNPFVFFFLFITLGTYSFIETGLRQALAMSICLWAVDFIKDKKPIRFILLVAFAYFFHKSAMIFLLTYPLCQIKKLDWITFAYIILTVFLAVNFTAFQGVFNSILGYDYSIEETGNGGIFLLFISVMAVYTIYIMYNKPKNELEGQSVIVNLAMLTVVFWVLRLISRTAERISYYFIFGLYTYFSQAVNYDKDKLSSLLKWLLILGCLVLFVYRNVGIGYLFFWQGV